MRPRPAGNISAIWGVIDVALSLILRLSQQIKGSRAFPSPFAPLLDRLPYALPFISGLSSPPPLSCRLLATSHLSCTSSIFELLFTPYF